MYQYSNQQADNNLRKKFLLTALISVLPFLVIGLIGYIDGTNITNWDYQIGAHFYDLRTPMRTEIAIAITSVANVLGQIITTILITLALILFKKWRTGVWFGVTVLGGALFINVMAKNFFGRVRPDQIEHLVDQGGFSYPSGHAMGSMIIYGGLLFILIRYINSLRGSRTLQKWLLSIIIVLIVLAIGLSRIYLGVHYPSDVIGGYSLGLAWLSLSIALYGLHFTKKEFQAKNRYRFNRL